MNKTIRLRFTDCPICQTRPTFSELYPPNFDYSDFNATVFSARRKPDGVHYRMVKCDECGLVRANPAADPQDLFGLYADSAFEYGEETANLNKTYSRYLRKLDSYVLHRGAMLEIGCGSGFFLEEASNMGYETVKGIEPSIAAVTAARNSVKSYIVCDVMRSGIFSTGEFDVICMFQVLDHVFDPNILIGECFKVLKPGGFILAITHDVEALSAKLLGESSPIVDIEHCLLFSRRTISRLFDVNRFEVKEIGKVINVYSLKYLAHLFPLPTFLKTMLSGALRFSGLGALNLSISLGNLYIIAQRPTDQ